MTLGDTDDVDHFVLREDILDGDGLLHKTAGEIHLLGDRAAVQLNLVNVGLLLALAEKLDLGVRDDADDGAVLLHFGKVLLDLLLAVLGGPLLRIFGESLLFGGVPSHKTERRKEKDTSDRFETSESDLDTFGSRGMWLR